VQGLIPQLLELLQFLVKEKRNRLVVAWHTQAAYLHHGIPMPNHPINMVAPSSMRIDS